MNSTETVTYISLAVIVASLIFIGTSLTGYATANDTAIVNVSINQSASINFTTDFLDFGSGAVVSGQIAYLDSEGTNTSWTGPSITGELILENIGNTDVTLELQADKNASEFLGGTSPTFEAKISNQTSNDGACTGAGVFSSYATINQTPQTACGTAFGYAASADEIIIDFNMTIPDDATGAKTIEIKAIGTY